MSRADAASFTARWVVPIEGEPIEDGLVRVRDGRIVAVEPRGRRQRTDVDFGNAAILPGFINAHTHLDLGPLEPPPGSDVEDQVAWLGRVIAARRVTNPDRLRECIASNVAACLRAGTTTLADVSATGLSEQALAASPLRAVVFAELIGLRRDRAMETSHHAFEWLAGARAAGSDDDPAAGRIRVGLSPHAPYSTVGWLYERAVTAQVPLTTHLAEMPAELELLATRQGPLRAFLEEIGAWDDDWRPLSAHPADYVRRHALRNADWLVAHGTYLDPADFWQFRPQAAPGGQRVAVAYCPRTTDRFGHGPHPYRELIARGGVVCLGTDSQASSPSLSVLDEVRHLAARGGADEPRLLLTMATLSGAWALRLEDEVGSLRVGKAADLAVVALPDRDDPDPHRLVAEGPGAVVATICRGRIVHGEIR